jgi:hypothetical protein
VLVGCCHDFDVSVFGDAVLCHGVRV